MMAQCAVYLCHVACYFLADIWRKQHTTCMWLDNYDSFPFASGLEVHMLKVEDTAKVQYLDPQRRLLFTIIQIQVPLSVCCSMRNKHDKVWGSVK